MNAARPCLRTLGLALVLAAGRDALAWPTAWAVQPSGCDSLDGEPPQFTIDYQAGIQGIFNTYCTGCHEGDFPPAGLDLGPGVSWGNLVGHASSQDAGLVRVVPNHPEQSLLFHKVNCATPDVGSRMPLGGGALPTELQALIYDWIAAGAPAGVTDTLFRGSFEPRG